LNPFKSKIQILKDNENSNFLKINFSGKVVTLKVVDTSEETIHKLTEWRKTYRHMFATNFEMYDSRTKDWIKEKILNNPNCILFIIYVDDEKIGNIGFDLYEEKQNSLELDNIMKDPSFNLPGLISTVEKPLLKWVFDDLKISKLFVKVFSDNFQTLNLHFGCGFKIIKTTPLKREYTNYGWIWKETVLSSENDFPERYIHTLEIKRNNLIKSFGEIDYTLRNN